MVNVKTAQLFGEDTAASAAATLGTDVGALDFDLSFPPNSTMQTVPVPHLQDEIDEDRERYKVVLSNPRFAVIDSEAGEAVGGVQDEDDRPSASIEVVGDSAVPEKAGTLTFRVFLDRPSERRASRTIEVETGHRELDGSADSRL